MSAPAVTADDPDTQRAAELEVIFDARLASIAGGSWEFEAAGRTYRLDPGRPGWWEVGTMGRLWRNKGTRQLEFTAYPDQRLRRCRERDDRTGLRWGWQLGEQFFTVKAGVIPGKGGVVLREDTERLEFSIPSEFVSLCRGWGLSPDRLLRAYIADLCDLRNCADAPREDRYESGGNAQRYAAQIYFQKHSRVC